jgi:hypothetical protein
MALNKEKIDAIKFSLEESKKLYNDTKQEYDKLLLIYDKAKVVAEQSKSFVSSLNVPGLDPTQILQRAATLSPDPQTYLNQVNQSRGDAQAFLKKQRDEASKNFRLVENVKKKAEKEFQRITRSLNGLSERITVLTEQLGTIVKETTLTRESDISIKESIAKIAQRQSKITLNGVKILFKKNQAAIKAIAKAAALYTVAKLLNSQITKLSKTVNQLDTLVNSVNDQIISIQTKQDVLKAKVTRDAALNTLNTAERQITQVRNTIRTLETLARIISLALRVALLIPIPPFTPLKVTQKVINATLTLDAITILLGIVKEALNDLISEVQYQRSRLLPISDIIDDSINNNLTPIEIKDLLDRLKLGPLTGVVYRGFTFAILEENNPRFVVSGNKRRYAVAYDRSGFVVLQSKPSFTLDPEVLIDELKLIIDEQNLKP